MYPILRPLLFTLDPETAHGLTLRLIRLGGFQPFRSILKAFFAAPQKPLQVFGLNFLNPIGLAAGYDKNATAWCGLGTLGFSHIELGTVTLLPQAGNPKPRLFRLVEDRGLINRMGFPGEGAEAVAARIQPAGRRPPAPILGVNLGKGRDTPVEEAARDYLPLLRLFAPLADYLVINVSSPNTAGLRRLLQEKRLLEGLLSQVARERRGLVKNLPILVKLSPDLSEHELDQALDAILRSGMDGVIATNTSLARGDLQSAKQWEAGGLSGRPLAERSEAILLQTVRGLDGRLPVVSAGGVMCAEDARRRLDMGASLVQVYTGLVYAGPGLVKQILKSL